MKKFVTINRRPPNHTTQLATFVLSRSPLSPLAFTCCLPSFLIFFIISIHALLSLSFPLPHTHTHTHTHTHIHTQTVISSIIISLSLELDAGSAGGQPTALLALLNSVQLCLRGTLGQITGGLYMCQVCVCVCVCACVFVFSLSLSFCVCVCVCVCVRARVRVRARVCVFFFSLSLS